MSVQHPRPRYCREKRNVTSVYKTGQWRNRLLATVPAPAFPAMMKLPPTLGGLGCACKSVEQVGVLGGLAELGDVTSDIAPRPAAGQSLDEYGNSLILELKKAYLRAAVKVGVNPDAVAKAVLSLATMGISDFFVDLPPEDQAKLTELSAANRILDTWARNKDQAITDGGKGVTRTNIYGQQTQYDWNRWIKDARDVAKIIAKVDSGAWSDTILGTIPQAAKEAAVATAKTVATGAAAGAAAGLGAYTAYLWAAGAGIALISAFGSKLGSMFSGKKGSLSGLGEVKLGSSRKKRRRSQRRR